MDDEKTLLAGWAEKEDTLRAYLAGLEADQLGISKNLLKKICEVVKAIAFGCSSDSKTSNVRQGTLAEMFGVSRRTMHRWIKLAKELRLLKVMGRTQVQDGLRISNETTIDWDSIKNLARKNVSAVTTKRHNRCDKMSQPLRQNVVAITNPKPTKNNLELKPVRKESGSLVGEGWNPESFAQADRAATWLERRLKITSRDRDAIREAQEIAIDICGGIIDRGKCDQAIAETLKSRPGKSPPATAIARVRYFKAVLGRLTSEWASR